MTPTELELVAARDEGAMARFYDRHVAGVRRFCDAVCPADRVEEAVEAAIVNFLARVTEAPSDAAPEDLLRRATREAAVGRMKPEAAAASDSVDAVCLAMPELLAAAINDELPGSADLVGEHLASCSVCQTSAARLEHAENAFAAWPTDDRAAPAAWLELAGGPGASPAAPEALRSGPRQSWPERPIRIRARRGGLVGAVRQLARSRGRNQEPTVPEHRP